MERLVAPRAPDRVGQPARERQRVLRAGRRHGGRACSTATRSSAATASTPSARSSTRSVRGPVRAAAGGDLRGPRGRGGRALGERHARAGQLGGDAERIRPEQGEHHPWMGRASDRGARPASTRDASGRRCLHTSSGGPQPAFCDLEEHNALSAHQERERLASRTPANHEEEDVVADEAYRAVFLRVHPTGKMVLSLTTEADGKEPEYARLVAGELGVPALDVKVVPADTDRFGVGHGYNTSPSPGTPAAVVRASEQDPRQGAGSSRGRRWMRRPETLTLVERRLGRRRRQRPGPGEDDRGPRPLRARHGRPSSGRGGRARRAGRVPRLAGTELALEHDLHLVLHLQRPEKRGVGLHAPCALGDHRGRAERAGVIDGEVERDRLGPARELRSPSTRSPAPARPPPGSSGT